MATSTREVESDTASEEDEVVLKVDKKASLIAKQTSDSLEVNIDEEETRDGRYLNYPGPLNMTDFRTPFVRVERCKEDNVPASEPRKRKIKSLILGKNRKAQGPRQKSPTPPQSPPPKRVKAATRSPEKPASKSEVEIVEPHMKKDIKTFHHSGPKNYFLQDGPVTLTPFENHHAKGGFGVRCSQNGKFVGFISSGEEPL